MEKKNGAEKYLFIGFLIVLLAVILVDTRFTGYPILPTQQMPSPSGQMQPPEPAKSSCTYPKPLESLWAGDGNLDCPTVLKLPGDFYGNNPQMSQQLENQKEVCKGYCNPNNPIAPWKTGCTSYYTRISHTDCLCSEGENAINAPSDCKPICGNGVMGGDEGCDDGNRISGDGCGESCCFDPPDCKPGEVLVVTNSCEESTTPVPTYPTTSQPTAPQQPTRCYKINGQCDVAQGENAISCPVDCYSQFPTPPGMPSYPEPTVNYPPENMQNPPMNYPGMPSSGFPTGMATSNLLTGMPIGQEDQKPCCLESRCVKKECRAGEDPAAICPQQKLIMQDGTPYIFGYTDGFCSAPRDARKNYPHYELSFLLENFGKEGCEQPLSSSPNSRGNNVYCLCEAEDRSCYPTMGTVENEGLATERDEISIYYSNGVLHTFYDECSGPHGQLKYKCDYASKGSKGSKGVIYFVNCPSEYYCVTKEKGGSEKCVKYDSCEDTDGGDKPGYGGETYYLIGNERFKVEKDICYIKTNGINALPMHLSEFYCEHGQKMIKGYDCADCTNSCSCNDCVPS